MDNSFFKRFANVTRIKSDDFEFVRMVGKNIRYDNWAFLFFISNNGKRFLADIDVVSARFVFDFINNKMSEFIPPEILIESESDIDEWKATHNVAGHGYAYEKNFKEFR